MLRATSRPIVLTILLLFTSSASAQRDRDSYNPNNQGFEVSGQVSLADEHKPAQNVPVRLEKFSGGLIDQMNTDGHGRFRFTSLQRGYYRVIINAPGLKPMQQDADLQVVSKQFLVFEAVYERTGVINGLPSTADVIDARAPALSRDEFVLGRSALAKKNYAEAVTHLQKALDGYPEFFDARLLLSTALTDLREWTKAEDSFKRSLELKPGNTTAMIGLGEVYWRQKKFKDAEETLLAALKDDERSWYGHFTLARVYWDLGDVPKSGVAVGRTLQLKSDFAEARYNLGVASRDQAHPISDWRTW